MADSERVLSSNWENLETPPRVNPDDLRKTVDTDGRIDLAIRVPAYLNDYSQTLSRNYLDFVEAILIENGIDSEEATHLREQIGVRSGLSLRHFKNAAAMGYAGRILEERAGLPPLGTMQEIIGNVEALNG